MPVRNARQLETTRPTEDGYRPPRSVHRPELLDGGDDRRFRQLLVDLAALQSNLATVRAHFAELLGLSARQYSILMTVAYNQGDNGITVSEVAERLHVSGPFITTETSALVSRELLLKIPNPRDRRSVLLRLAARGQRKLKELAPHLADVNDAVFTPLGVEEFQMLSTITTELVATSARAIALLSASPPTLLDREDH